METIEWRETKEGFRARQYNNYKAYLSHQKAKRLVYPDSYNKRYKTALLKRIKGLRFLREARNILCLGARYGAEVEAFIENGNFAIGLDINTRGPSKYVLIGDFHRIQFADNSVDVVFTNSLDHVYSLNKVLCEIHRVTKPLGYFITEIVYGSKEGTAFGRFESFTWQNINDLVSRIKRSGFNQVTTYDFTCPWKGQQVIFRRD